MKSTTAERMAPDLLDLEAPAPFTQPEQADPKERVKRKPLHKNQIAKPKCVVLYDPKAVSGFAAATLWLVYRNPKTEAELERRRGMAITEQVELSPGLQLVEAEFFDRYINQDDELINLLASPTDGMGALVKAFDSPEEIVSVPTHEIIRWIGWCLSPVALPVLAEWEKTAIMDNPRIAEALNKQKSILGGATDQFVGIRGMIPQ